MLTAHSPLPASPSVRFSARHYDLTAIAVLAVLSICAALTFRDYGLGWDDYTHSEYGELLLAYYGSGLTDRRALSFVNLYMYGGGFDLLSTLAARVLPFDGFETRRLIGAVIGIIGLAVTWRLARRLGGPLAGLLALVLLAATPMFYGHMYMNAKDGPFAVAMCVLLLALVRAIQEYPAPSRGTVAFLGLALGLVVGTRILGGIAALFVIAPLALLVGHDLREHGAKPSLRRLGWFVLVASAGLPLGYLVMGLLWPWSVLEPLNPVRAIAYFSHFFEKPWRELYEGMPVLVPEMPASYVPRLLALKLPESVLILTLAGCAGIIYAATRRSIEVHKRAGLLLILSAAVVPVAYAMISRPALYNGLRHFVFIVPPIAVIAGIACAWGLEWLRTRGTAAWVAGIAALALGLTVTVRDMVQLHPYQYAYFNALAGGVRGADRGYMLDYWGLAFKQATDQLRFALKTSGEKPPAGRSYWIVAVCGPQRVAQVGFGSKFRTTSDPKGADFALVLREFYCREVNAPVVTEVVREGVAFATVYDIRGRTVRPLSTP
jgi:4-amino-4-deoxy-L-arabinose transferase-like glycosyltransferase